MCRLLATLAKSLVEIRGVDPALQVLDESIEWSDCLGDAELQALLAGQQALILFRGGRMAEAKEAFSRATAGLPLEGLDMVRVLLNRGALLVETGQVSEARSDLNRAVDLAHELRHAQYEHFARHNLGCLEFAVGNLPLALRLMQDALEPGGRSQQGLTHLDRSRVLLAAGLPDEADEALAEAAELFRRDRCWQDLAEVDLTRAEVALLTDRSADARRLAGRARDRFRRHGNDRWRRAAELVLLRADLAAGRPAARLLPQARRLADEFAAAGFGLQSRSALLLAAELELALRHVDEAEEVLGRVGRVFAVDPIEVRLHARLVRARTLEARERVPAARRVLARGLADLAAYQAQFAGVELQSASAVHGRRLAVHDVELALQSGRPASVVTAVERSRAVSTRIRPVTPPADERSAELLAELRRAVDAQGGPAGGRPPDEAGRRRVAVLQDELRSRSWLNGGSRAWQPPTRLADLRAAATEDDAVLITITEIRRRLTAVRIPVRGRLRLVDLGPAEAVRHQQRRLTADLDLLAHGGGLPPTMAAAAGQSARRAAVELGRLLAPVLVGDDRRVVLSPPNTLLGLPWPLLPALTGRPVTVTPSLGGWFRGRSLLRTRDPESSGTDRAATTARTWSLTAAAGPGLARSTEEVGEVARAWQQATRASMLPDATPSQLLAAMTTDRVVHVAAHGVHRGENPMFSSLTLAGGPLFAYELDQRGRSPEHVVLSSCEVGRSTARVGGESLGLTSVLLQLGTACVVAGVARVHDEVATALMRRYHAELAGGRDAAEALSLAATGAGAPSPFVCFGSAWRAWEGRAPAPL